MGTLDKHGVVTMEELLVSSLATADALTKLLIEKGLITEAEFMQKLSGERARYQAMVRKMCWVTVVDKHPMLLLAGIRTL